MKRFALGTTAVLLGAATLGVVLYPPYVVEFPFDMPQQQRDWIWNRSKYLAHFELGGKVFRGDIDYMQVGVELFLCASGCAGCLEYGFHLRARSRRKNLISAEASCQTGSDDA